MDFWETIGKASSILGLFSFLGISWSVVVLKAMKMNPKKWFSNVGEILPADEKFDGIIFTVSHDKLPNLIIDRINPKRIGLVATAESRDAAVSIKRHAEQKGSSVLGIIEIDDADNPAESKDATAHLIAKLKKEEITTIAVDITGSKKTMSIGAFMAAQEAGVTTVYLKADYDPKLTKTIPGTTQLIRISA